MSVAHHPDGAQGELDRAVTELEQVVDLDRQVGHPRPAVRHQDAAPRAPGAGELGPGALAACLSRSVARSAGPSLRWSNSGHRTLLSNGRQYKLLRTIVAGQPPSAQVAGACGTVYGSEGWGFESLRARHRLPRSQRWSLSGRVENLAELLHDEHGLALVVAELGDGKVGRWIGAPSRRSGIDRFRAQGDSVEGAKWEGCLRTGLVLAAPAPISAMAQGTRWPRGCCRLHRPPAHGPSAYSTEPPSRVA